MNTENVILSGKSTDLPKHTALTKMLRSGIMDPYTNKDFWEHIILACKVNFHVGCLPPELLRLIDKSKLSNVTACFFDILDFLVIDKGTEFAKRARVSYALNDIAELFHTPCILKTCEKDSKFNCSYHIWEGSIGDVYKLCFPNIKVEYALKIFRSFADLYDGHGVKYEIPSAFCANKCEPKLNNPIYMANLFGAQYMLSKWVYDEDTDCDGVKKKHKNLIFKTLEYEQHSDNFKNNLRIDFGSTYRTRYGHLSYRARKIYRQMQHMQPDDIKKMLVRPMNNFDRNDVISAYAVALRAGIIQKCL